MTEDYGAIVQIIDPYHHWYPSLIIVSDVKSWGIEGYVTLPDNNQKPKGNAYIRLERGTYEVVGKATVIVAD